MPYIRTEEVKEIRDALKANPKLKKFKLSVVRHHHSSVHIAIMKGPDLGTKNININKFWYKDHLTEFPKLVKVLAEIEKTVLKTKEQRTVVEDGDYGSIPNYYWDMSLGKWNKEYEVVK